ncbi:MAG TPA: hypothetical protein VK619_09325 [Pyrinomonadaceae bacterium]|nr:hypothetical protein [Pyrinomonadaceae bacterium]
MKSVDFSFSSGSDEQSSLLPTMRRDFLASMCVLGFIALSALCRIALQSNWIKCVRVSIAFSVYSLVLISLFRLDHRKSETDVRLPFWRFALAGALAELASGWLRPDASVTDELFMIPAAAVLVGGFHWLVLKSRRPLRNRIERSANAGQAA